MAIMEARQLLEMRPMYGPQAQQEILNEATAVFTNNPRKANRWVPINQAQKLTSGAEFAQAVFGTLMQGVPVQPKEGLSPIDQIETLLGLMAGKCASIQKRGMMTDAGTIDGLVNVGQFIGGLIEQLAQNPQEKQRVKVYSDDLGKLMNEVKSFAQRLQEQQGQQQGENGNGELAKAMATIRGKMMLDQAKAKQTELSQAQKRRHKEISFAGEQRRKDAATIAEVGRTNLRTAVELQGARAKMKATQE